MFKSHLSLNIFHSWRKITSANNIVLKREILNGKNRCNILHEWLCQYIYEIYFPLSCFNINFIHSWIILFMEICPCQRKTITIVFKYILPQHLHLKSLMWNNIVFQRSILSFWSPESAVGKSSFYDISPTAHPWTPTGFRPTRQLVKRPTSH